MKHVAIAKTVTPASGTFGVFSCERLRLCPGQGAPGVKIWRSQSLLFLRPCPSNRGQYRQSFSMVRRHRYTHMDRHSPFQGKWVTFLSVVCTGLVLAHGFSGAREELHALHGESAWTEALQTARGMRRQIESNVARGVTDLCAGVSGQRSAAGHTLRCEGGRIVVQAGEVGGKGTVSALSGAGRLVLSNVAPAGPVVWRCHGHGIHWRELPNACFP